MVDRSPTSSRITRRRFTAGALAVAAATAGRTTYARNGTNERIRVGILGCRNRGWQVAGEFNCTGLFDIVGFCDPDAAMIELGLKTLNSHPDARLHLAREPRKIENYKEVLDDKGIDAVVIAAPDHWHAKMTVEALEAGKHVFCEKPASYCINDGKAMVAAARRHPKLAACIGTQQRSGQHFKDAKSCLAEGTIGKVGFVRAFVSIQRGPIPITPDTDPPAGFNFDLWTGPAELRPYNPHTVHYNWHFMRHTGTGDTGNWSGHWIDSARHLLDLDLPRGATGRGMRHVQPDAREWFDTQSIVFDYPDLMFVWEMRTWARAGQLDKDMGIEFFGDKGTLFIDRGGWTVFPYPKGPEDKPEPIRHPTSDMTDAHGRNFAAVIRGEAAPAASVEEGHKSAIHCHLANIVSTLQRPVRFDPAEQTILDDPEAVRMMSRHYRQGYELPEAYRQFAAS